MSTPSVSLSVSVSSPHTDVPSVHTILETESSEESNVLSRDINRLIQHIHDLDQHRGEENHDLADNVRRIRDELYDLSDFLRQRETPEAPPPVPHKDRFDRSVGGSSIISQVIGPRAMPGMPPHLVPPHLVPIPLTPPPVRIPSPSSIMTSDSYLSSHHSDDYSLMESESYPGAPSSPPWSSSSDESSTTTSGPYMSRTSSSPRSSPTFPPTSPTPTSSSISTARPLPPDNALNNLRDLLEQLRNQTGALWDGQVSTNHMLDDLRGRRADDDTETGNRLRNIEGLLQQVLDQSARQAPRPPLESVYSTSSDALSDLDSIRRRWDDLTRRRQQPIHAPIPVRTGPSLDDQLADLLGAPPPVPPPAVQPPPPLVPFTYQPAPRASRPRSLSPTLDIPIRPYTAPVRFGPDPEPFRRPPRRREPRPPPSADWRSDLGVPQSPRVVPMGPSHILEDPRMHRRPGFVPPAEPVLVSYWHVSPMFRLLTLWRRGDCMTRQGPLLRQ